MKNDQRLGGLFSGLSYDESLKTTAIKLRGELLGDKSAATLPLEPRLHDIHAILRGVWPKDFPFSVFSDDAEMLKQATPKQKAAWHLSQMTLVLQRLTRATSPDIESIANLAIDIGLGVMAVAANKKDLAEMKSIVASVVEKALNQKDAAEQRKREEAKAHRSKRRAKDPRPLPGRHIKAQYANKAAELVNVIESNRQVAEQLEKWAVERGGKDEEFGRFRVLKNTALQKLAAMIREDQVAERARRQKRIKGANTNI